LSQSPKSAAPLSRRDVAPILARFGESRTLPAGAYTSADVFDWEVENLFAKTWMCVGRSDELVGPGQIHAIDVMGEGVLLARDRHGRLTAFSNVCRHRGHELAPVNGPIDASLIRCPYHSWSYRLSGELRAAPTLTRSPDFDMSDFPLVPIRVADYLGWLWIDLSGGAAPIEETFGNLADMAAPYEPGRLRTAVVHNYEVAANWKTVVENYNECYHCSSIHPELCEVSPPDSGRDHQPTGLWCGGTMTLKPHAVTMSLDGSSSGARFRGVDDTRSRHVWYLTVMPNLLLSMHPDYVMTHRLTPVSSIRTLVECAWLFPPEAFELSGFDPAYAIDFWDITNREDWAACESVMRGLHNRGYRPGPLSAWEGTVYQFLSIMGHLYLGEGLVTPQVPVRERR
jgi:Rieske 2Fe-2S family protein